MILRIVSGTLGILSLIAAFLLSAVSVLALTSKIEFQIVLLAVSGVCGLIFAFIKNKFLTGGYAVIAVLIFSYILAFSD